MKECHFSRLSCYTQPIFFLHSHLKKDPDSQIAYQFNRYLNLCHVLIYHGCNESLDFELKDLKACGLIQTKQELDVLELIDTYENKLR